MCLAARPLVSKTLVQDLMVRDVVTLSANEEFSLADQVMKLNRIRHLPVVDGGRLVGMVSHRDLLRAQSRLLAKASVEPPPGTRVVSVNVAEIMTKDVLTVSPTTAASEAARLLLVNKTGCLPVVEDGELVGIVTEADFLKWATLRLDAGH